MNQPTREEFDQLKAEVAKLKEQATEPIRIGRLEIEQKDVQVTLDNHTAFLKELDRKSDLHTGLINELRVDMQKRFDAIADVQMLILDRLPEKGK